MTDEADGAVDLVPDFEPHPMFRGGHAQTLAGRYLPGRAVRLRARAHELELEDGDRLVVLESAPSTDHEGGPTVVLVHGLAGNASAPYVTRVGARLVDHGVRVVRVNLRGAGAGFGLARGIYHAGRSDDLRAVTAWLARRWPGSPIGLVGFSLGGNLVLKLAAEAATEPVPGLDCVLAASPPLDLAACCRYLQRPAGRVYDRNFVRMLRRDVARLHQRFPELEPVDLRAARTLLEFDELYTAKRNGFGTAARYYEDSSAGPRLDRIRVDGLIVHAEDDPFIPAEPFRRLAPPPNLQMDLRPRGGHLGFVSRHPWGADRRWLDARLTHWLTRRWRAVPDILSEPGPGHRPGRSVRPERGNVP